MPPLVGVHPPELVEPTEKPVDVEMTCPPPPPLPVVVLPDPLLLVVSQFVKQ